MQHHRLTRQRYLRAQCFNRSHATPHYATVQSCMLGGTLEYAAVSIARTRPLIMQRLIADGVHRSDRRVSIARTRPLIMQLVCNHACRTALCVVSIARTRPLIMQPADSDAIAMLLDCSFNRSHATPHYATCMAAWLAERKHACFNRSHATPHYATH